jgi:hypothetical protein
MWRWLRVERAGRWGLLVRLGLQVRLELLAPRVRLVRRGLREPLG